MKEENIKKLLKTNDEVTKYGDEFILDTKIANTKCLKAKTETSNNRILTKPDKRPPVKSKGAKKCIQSAK